MAGLVFLFFWFLGAGGRLPKARHGVGGFLLCNTTTNGRGDRTSTTSLLFSGAGGRLPIRNGVGGFAGLRLSSLIYEHDLSIRWGPMDPMWLPGALVDRTIISTDRDRSDRSSHRPVRRLGPHDQRGATTDGPTRQDETPPHCWTRRVVVAALAGLARLHGFVDRLIFVSRGRRRPPRTSCATRRRACRRSRVCRHRRRP